MAFLRYCAEVDDALTELFEVLVGTGLRKGEALALHWSDVDLDERVLFVGHTLSNVNNTTPVFTTPKTKTSLDWFGLSAPRRGGIAQAGRAPAPTTAGRGEEFHNQDSCSVIPTANRCGRSTCCGTSTS